MAELIDQILNQENLNKLNHTKVEFRELHKMFLNI